MAENQNGWLYDIHSGICAGPASYEQVAKAGLIRTTYAGCPVTYVIRDRTDITVVKSTDAVQVRRPA